MACEIKDLTGNPLCSDSMKDLKDNAVIMDQYINSQELSVPDRLGVERTTWAGLEFKVNNAVDNAVGAIRLEWQTGLTNISNKEAQSIVEIEQAKQDAIDEILENGGVEILQSTGQSTTAVMSQKSVTDEIHRIDSVPVDRIFYYDTPIPPAGEIDRKGQSIDPITMPKLYARYGTHMPDDRDRVHRMAGPLAGSVGTTQEDAMQKITGAAGVLSRSSTGSTVGSISLIYPTESFDFLPTTNQIRIHNTSLSIDSSRQTRTADETRSKARIIIACNKIQ